MLLDNKQINKLMKTIPNWTLNDDCIEREYKFDKFTDGIEFINEIANLAELEEHHPDIDIRYNKVKLSITTHDEGGLTEQDFSLAKKIDEITE